MLVTRGVGYLESKFFCFEDRERHQLLCATVQEESNRKGKK